MMMIEIMMVILLMMVIEISGLLHWPCEYGRGQGEALESQVVGEAQNWQIKWNLQTMLILTSTVMTMLCTMNYQQNYQEYFEGTTSSAAARCVLSLQRSFKIMTRWKWRGLLFPQKSFISSLHPQIHSFSFAELKRFGGKSLVWGTTLRMCTGSSLSRL